MTQEVEVTQEDREQAGACYARMTGRGGCEATHADIINGRADDSVLVQAFARHRLAERERCAKVVGRMAFEADRVEVINFFGVEAATKMVKSLEAAAAAIRSAHA